MKAFVFDFWFLRPRKCYASGISLPTCPHKSERGVGVGVKSDNLKKNRIKVFYYKTIPWFSILNQGKLLKTSLIALIKQHRQHHLRI